MSREINGSTPIAMLTVDQLKEVLNLPAPSVITEGKEEGRKFVYGITGIARLFGCSKTTANRIKKSGKLAPAIKQIGRKIIVDAELALQLVGKSKK